MPRPSYARVFLTFARNSLVREMNFRANFLLETISSLGWVLMNVGFYILVFEYTPMIGRYSGWGKYEFFVNAPHETILSVGLSAEIGGTGRAVVGADSFSTFTPALFFGKGFGDLPDSLAFLKPFALTGQLGVTIVERPYHNPLYNHDSTRFECRDYESCLTRTGH